MTTETECPHLHQDFPDTALNKCLDCGKALGAPVPDELCTHVELGAEMTGGWYFAAHEPPIAVGMCHECIVWCREHFEPEGQMPWSEYAALIATSGRIEG